MKGKFTSFSPERVTFYGRSIEEYRLMFKLTDEDFGKRILDCPSGPASFIADCKEMGVEVIGVDPMYSRNFNDLSRIGKEDIEYIVDKITETKGDRVWEYYSSPVELFERQNDTLAKFINHYKMVREESLERPYVCSELPKLPFQDQEFDLALSSHFLFSFHRHHGTEFTLEAILELLRVAREVRITPLKTNEQSRHETFSDLRYILNKIEEKGFKYRVEKHTFKFQKGADELLIVEKYKQ